MAVLKQSKFRTSSFLSSFPCHLFSFAQFAFLQLLSRSGFFTLSLLISPNRCSGYYRRRRLSPPGDTSLLSKATLRASPARKFSAHPSPWLSHHGGRSSPCSEVPKRKKNPAGQVLFKKQPGGRFEPAKVRKSFGKTESGRVWKLDAAGKRVSFWVIPPPNHPR